MQRTMELKFRKEELKTQFKLILLIVSLSTTFILLIQLSNRIP